MLLVAVQLGDSHPHTHTHEKSLKIGIAIEYALDPIPVSLTAATVEPAGLLVLAGEAGLPILSVPLSINLLARMGRLCSTSRSKSKSKSICGEELELELCRVASIEQRVADNIELLLLVEDEESESTSSPNHSRNLAIPSRSTSARRNLYLSHSHSACFARIELQSCSSWQ